MSKQANSIYQDTWGWNAAFSMLWFANNWKWFIALLVVLPIQVSSAPDVPEALRNTYWGYVFSAGAVWAFIGPALLGGFSDRLGRRKVFLITGSLLTVAALAVLAGVQTFWLIVLGYLLLQVSDDVIQGAYGSLVPQIVPPESQPKASAVLSALNLFAQIGTAIVALILSGVKGVGLSFPQLVYCGIAIVQLISLGAVLWAIRGLKEPLPRPAADPEPFFKSLLAPWKSHDFRWVWVSRLCIMLGFYLVQPYMQYFLDLVIAKEGPEGTKLFSLFGLTLTGSAMAQNVILLSLSFAGAIGALLSNRRMSRWGLKKTISFAGMILGPVLLVIAFTRDFSFLWLLALVFGFAHGTFLSADWALGAAVAPDPDSLGKDMGIWNSAVVFAQIVAGLGGGLIDALNGISPGAFLGYTAAFILAGIFMFTGSRLVFRVRAAS
jgi:MFS family permease